MISKLILVSSCFIALTVSASIFLDVPRIAKASGFIRSKAGSSKIYAPYPSVLEKLFFNEGEFVKKGEIIGELTAERFAAGKSIDFQQAELSKSKETVVQSDLKNIDKVESLSSALTINQLASLREELTRLDAELNIAQARMAMLNRQANRQTLLVQQGFISQEATDQKASEILLFRGQVSNLERVKLALIREITKQTQELELNTSRANTQRSLASRELAVIRQEINEQSINIINTNISTEISKLWSYIIRLINSSSSLTSITIYKSVI